MFGRMGFGDKEIVCMMGAHTLGRAHAARSGEGAASTAYTKAGCSWGQGGGCGGGAAVEVMVMRWTRREGA